jgi:mannosyltransferase
MKLDKGIITITILGAILRLYHLTFNSFWLDEFATIMYSQGSFSTIWNYMIAGEYNPPGFYWIEHIVMSLAGTTEFTMRFIPVIAGILTIPVIYYLGKEMYDEKAGMIAALICTLSPWMIYYSQEARAYSLVILLCALATYYWIEATRHGKSPAPFVILLAVSFWLHFFTIIFAIPLIAIYLYRKGLNRAVLLYPIIILPVAIGMALLVGPRLSVGSNFGFVGLDLIRESIYQFAGFSIAGSVMFIALVILGLRQLYKYTVHERWDPQGVPPAPIYDFIFIVVFVYLTSIFLSYKITIVPRYFSFILPLMYVLIGATIRVFAVDVKTKNGCRRTNLISYLVIGLFLMLLLPSFVSLYTVPVKPDMRSATEYMKANFKPGDIYLYTDSYIIPLQFYYNNATYGTFEYKMVDTRGTTSTGPGPWAPEPGPPAGGQQHGQDWKNVPAKYYIVPVIDVEYSAHADDTIMWLQNNTALIRQYNFMEIRERIPS